MHCMLDRDLERVPVVRDGKPVGMLARHDLLKLIAGPPHRVGEGVGASPGASTSAGFRMNVIVKSEPPGRS